MFNPIFRGFILNQAQLDALVPFLNDQMSDPREWSRDELETQAQSIFEAAGCEVNETNNKRANTGLQLSRSDQ